MSFFGKKEEIRYVRAKNLKLVCPGFATPAGYSPAIFIDKFGQMWKLSTKYDTLEPLKMNIRREITL